MLNFNSPASGWGEKCRLTIDHSLTWSERLCRGDYYWRNGLITPETCPVSISVDQQIVEAVIAPPFGRWVDLEEVELVGVRHGLVCARLEHLFEVKCTFEELRADGDILAAGTQFVYPDNPTMVVSPCLGRYGHPGPHPQQGTCRRYGRSLALMTVNMRIPPWVRCLMVSA